MLASKMSLWRCGLTRSSPLYTVCNVVRKNAIHCTSTPLAKESEHQDQYQDFETETYLNVRFSSTDNNTLRTFPLQHLYKFYKSLGSTSLRVLDVGAGPIIAYAISAAPYASEIVLSEYLENNRKALQQWVDKDPKVFDWKAFFKHIVVDIEGGEEKDIEARKEKLRSLIKVAPCDVSADPMLPPQYMGQYDVIQSLLCLECIGPTKSDYVQAVTRVSKLLRPGGRIVLYHAETNPKLPGPALYRVGDKWFEYVRFSKETIFETLMSLGFTDIERESTTLPPELVLAGSHDPTITPAFFTATYK